MKTLKSVASGVAMLRAADRRMWVLLWVCVLFSSTVPTLHLVVLNLSVNAVAAAVQGDPDPSLLGFAVAFGILVQTSTVLDALQNFATLRIAQKTQRGGVHELLGVTSRMELADFENVRALDALSLSLREASDRPTAFLNGLVQSVKSCITLALVLAVVASWQPILACLLLVPAVVAVTADLITGRRVFNLVLQQARERRVGSYWASLLTSQVGHRDLTVAGGLDSYIERWHSLTERLDEQHLRAQRQRLVLVSLLGILGSLAFGGALTMAINEAISRQSVGFLATYVTSFTIASTAVGGVLGGVGRLGQDARYLEQVRTFTAQFGAERICRPLAVAQADAVTVEFDHVSFTYPGMSEPALKDVSVTLRPGESVALIGENGSGKSTMVKLLAGMYEPTSGAIRVNGVDLNRIDRKSYYQSANFLFQDYARIEGTVRDNIVPGESGAPCGARLDAALQGSDFTSILAGLPDGLGTRLGRAVMDGQELSGGQWQRLAICRALYQASGLIVLDEPSAALDPEAERTIVERLLGTTTGVTRVVVTHRMSALRSADRVLVLAAGRLAEQGCHDDLLSLNGIYAAFHEAQFA